MFHLELFPCVNVFVHSEQECPILEKHAITMLNIAISDTVKVGLNQIDEEFPGSGLTSTG